MKSPNGDWPGSRQSGVEQMKIPLNLPLQRETFYSPPFQKGGRGDFLDKRELSTQFSKVKLTSTSPWGSAVAVVGDGCDLRFLCVGWLYRGVQVNYGLF